MASGGEPLPDLEAYTRYSRILLLIGKPCTEIERKLLEVHLARYDTSLEDHLRAHRDAILNKKAGKHNRLLYYPIVHAADIEKWDLGAVCFIITDFSTLPHLLKDDIVLLRHVRNELCHCNAPNLDDDKYRRHISWIHKITKRALDFIGDPDFSAYMDRQMLDIESGSFTASLHEYNKQMHDWYKLEQELSEKVDHLSEEMQLSHQKLDSIVKLLQRTGNQIPNIPECPVDIEMENCSEEQEAAITSRFMEHFDECIKDNPKLKRLREDETEEIKEAAYSAFKKLKSEGKEITKTIARCLRLRVKCLTTETLIGLLEDCINGRLDDLLKPLEAAVQRLPGYENYKQKVVLYREEYIECIYKLVEQLCVTASASAPGSSNQMAFTTASFANVGRNKLLLSFNQESNAEIVEEFVRLSPVLKRAFTEDELSLSVEQIGTFSGADRTISPGSAGAIRDSMTVVSMMTSLGKLEEAKLTEFGKLLVKREGDKKNVRITGLEMLDEKRLLCLDCNNNSLKIVSLRTEAVEEHLTLSCYLPWDLTLMPGEIAAVTVPKLQKIFVVATRGGLKLERTFGTNGRCQGICRLGENLVVTYNNSDKIEIMDFDGVVKKVISGGQDKGSVFSKSLYVTQGLCGTETCLYASSFDKNTIIKASSDGDIVYMHEDEKLNLPEGIASFGNGMLAVCNHKTGTICVLKDVGSFMEAVCVCDCVKRPQGLLCHGEMLYVTCEDMHGGARNYVHIYKVEKA